MSKTKELIDPTWLGAVEFASGVDSFPFWFT